MASNSIFHPLLLQNIYMIAHAQLVYHSFICKSTSSNNESIVLLPASMSLVFFSYVASLFLLYQSHIH